MDLEARARGTTVYMVGKSWHMLPGVLRLVSKLPSHPVESLSLFRMCARLAVDYLILLFLSRCVVVSENLCSLIGGKDRLAVSVVWTVDPDNEFEVLDVWFGRTVIQSRHQVESSFELCHEESAKLDPLAAF